MSPTRLPGWIKHVVGSFLLDVAYNGSKWRVLLFKVASKDQWAKAPLDRFICTISQVAALRGMLSLDPMEVRFLQILMDIRPRVVCLPRLLLCWVAS
jgi:hypothetical protein